MKRSVDEKEAAIWQSGELGTSAEHAVRVCKVAADVATRGF